MDVLIGTSGYVYPEWVGPFYPPGTTSAKMLPIYAEHFPLVELNFTYYQMPRMEQLANMVKRVPPDFRFVTKAHRSLTHDRDAQEVDAFRASLQPIRDGDKLLDVLCQFPQQFHYTKPNLRWLDHAYRQMAGLPMAVEFRHYSWDVDAVRDWLGERNIDLVSVDVPDIPALFPRKLVQSGRHAYLRFHSRRGEHWYAAGHDRYDYLYSDAEMGEWTQALADRAGQIDRALIFFNNCRRSQAIMNANRLAELMGQQPHTFHVILPAKPSLHQGTLF